MKKNKILKRMSDFTFSPAGILTFALLTVLSAGISIGLLALGHETAAVWAAVTYAVVVIGWPGVDLVYEIIQERRRYR